MNKEHQERAQLQQMPFNEYWENIVGKVSKLEDEIRAKQEEVTKLLLDTVEKYAVIPESTYEVDKEHVEAR